MTKDQIKMSFLGRINFFAPLNCWEWTGGKTNFGYGSSYYLGKHIKSHRLSYLLFKGSIPKSKIVMHSCDNPSCVNPDHLSVGTHKENMSECVRKGRFRGGHIRFYCKRGHELTEENSYRYPNPAKGRMCRICKTAYSKKWRELKETKMAKKGAKKPMPKKKPGKKGC